MERATADKPVAGAVKAPARITSFLRPSAPVVVGVVTLLLLVLATIWVLNKSRVFVEKYTFQIAFPEVSGLGGGARVQLMGVRIGRVKSLAALAERVIVTVEIDDSETRILRNAVITVTQNGLMGDKVVDIMPNKAVPKERPVGYIEPGQLVYGTEPPSLTGVMADAQHTMKTLRSFAEDPEMRQRLRSSREQLVGARDSALVAMKDFMVLRDRSRLMLAKLQQLQASAPTDRVKRELRLVNTSIDATMRDLRSSLADPRNRQNIAEMQRNMAEANERFQRLMQDYRELTGGSPPGGT